jgi:hypothetical protein
MKSIHRALCAVTALLLYFVLQPAVASAANLGKNEPEKNIEQMGEGKTTIGSVTAGPFFIDRK